MSVLKKSWRILGLVVLLLVPAGHHLRKVAKSHNFKTKYKLCVFGSTALSIIGIFLAYVLVVLFGVTQIFLQPILLIIPMIAWMSGFWLNRYIENKLA